MLKTIEHPESFKSGTRVLNLLSRNKDEGEQSRTILRVSHNELQFDRRYAELLSLAKVGQRIYVSSEPRDMTKATRAFKQAQLDADYDADTAQFYQNIGSRWASALMKPAGVERQSQLWLLDCDSVEEIAVMRADLQAHYDRGFIYEYKTKSGLHVLVKPFNMTVCSDRFQNLIHKNAMMLWAY